jgi:hypothetical protein
MIKKEVITMARGNIYTCVTCGEKHQFCPKCQIVKPNYDYERYCSKVHADIFAILSKHGCGLATAEETLEALASYDTTGLVEDIAKHIESLKVETKREVEHDEPTQE